MRKHVRVASSNRSSPTAPNSPVLLGVSQGVLKTSSGAVRIAVRLWDSDFNLNSARQPHANIKSRRCPPLGPLERRRAVAGKGGEFAEDCLSCRLVQCVLSNSTASSTGAELVEQHRDTTSVAVNQGRPSLGYFSWPRKKSDQPRVCHPEKVSPPRLPPGEKCNPRFATGFKE